MAIISFTNAFLSYLLVMAVIVCVATVGFLIGYTLRKKKNAKTDIASLDEQNE